MQVMIDELRELGTGSGFAVAAWFSERHDKCIHGPLIFTARLAASKHNPAHIIYTVDRKKRGSTFDIITLEKHARFL